MAPAAEAGVRETSQGAGAIRVGSRLEDHTAHWFFSEDAEQNRASLETLYRRLDVEHVQVTAIACAHSGVMTNGSAALADFARAAS
jgi:hypothetical protein